MPSALIDLVLVGTPARIAAGARLMGETISRMVTPAGGHGKRSAASASAR